MKKIVNEFVEWARECGEDALYIFDNTDEAIEKFLKQREKCHEPTDSLIDKFLAPQEFAAKLDGREYGSEITREEQTEALQNRLVVVYGNSDDLIEFNGCIDDERTCFMGDDFGIKSKNMKVKRGYLKNKISAIWNNKELGTSWSYETNIPHATFKINEEENLYCIGIVFSIYDLK